MKSIQLDSCKNQKGFTLVELAIVMVIIGLLITGILKGQEMIANAQTTATISAAKGLDAATSTFRDMYSAFPGDMATAVTRLPNCNTIVCNNGSGNGQIAQGVGAITGTGAGAENIFYFNQMLAVDLLSGFDGTLFATYGQGLPTAPIGGGWTVGHNLGAGGAGFTATEFRPGHYVVLNGNPAAVVGNTTGVATAKQAAIIDRKMDDGVPSSGFVVAQTALGATLCRLAVATYNEAAATAVCALAIRVQG